jgi:hypothetical protein
MFYVVAGSNNPYDGKKLLTQVWNGGWNAKISFLDGSVFRMPTIAANSSAITLDIISNSGGWGHSAQFGVDLNANGQIDWGTTEAGPGWWLAFNNAIYAADRTTTAYTRGGTGGWQRRRFTLDLQTGKISLQYQNLVTTTLVANPVWAQEASNVDAKLNWGAADAQNPLLWKGIVFFSEADSMAMESFNVTVYPKGCL